MQNTVPLRVCFPFENLTIGGSYYATKLMIEQLEGRDITSIGVVHNLSTWSEEVNEAVDHFFMLDIVLPFARPGRRALICDLIKSAWQLARFILKNKIDIVHTNEDSTAIPWAIACKLAGIKHIWHQHALPNNSRLTRLLRNNTDALVSISSYISDSLTEFGRAPDLLVGNSFSFNADVYLEKEDRINKKKVMGFEGDELLLMFVGSLTEQKRPLDAITACASIKERTSRNVSLLMFGDDRNGLEDELRQYADKLGIGANVKFMGTSKELGAFYQISNFLLAPAVNEGFGRVLIEAMYYGCIVVAASSGGHCEIVDDGVTGYLFMPQNVEDLCLVIETCLDDMETAQKVAAKAQIEVRSKLESEEHLHDLLNMYHNLVVA